MNGHDQPTSTHTEGTSRQTLSQRRAAYALTSVKALEDATFQGEVRSYAANLPPMIQMNGFGQALAFCRSKSGAGTNRERAYRALYTLVSDWLVRPDQPYADHTDALDGIVAESMSVYRLAQTETLALLDWVKRFASAYLRSPSDEDSGEAGSDEIRSSTHAAS